nr:PREDICTED: myb-like protein X isoform X1 [Linepithema humile]
MLRSTKESDDEAESKTGRIQTRILSSHMVNSPLRRSSRIKQAKISPGSESDTSNNSQPVRITRQRTATMDSIVSETVKKRLTRYTSVSSDLNEASDIDMGTPTKRRITKNSTTPTRATNKRLTRAGSEAKSPTYVKITRRTRSSSVEPESLQEQNKSQPSTPVRIRRRTSMLPSGSPVKEEAEEGNITPKRLNPTITEIDELTGTDKIAIVPVLLKSDEILSLSQNKSKIQSEHMDQVTMNKEQTVVEGQSSSEESLLPNISVSDEKSTDNNSSCLLESNKEDKSKESLLVEQSLIDICQDSSTKNLTENSLNTFIEEQKRSNKENETSNIISGTSAEKNIQPFISNVVSLSTKQSLTSALVNKLDEKEEKSEETNKISPMNQTETQEKNVSKKNLDTNIITEDGNEMNLILEERSLDRRENEALLNVSDSDNENSDNENSENQSNIMDKQSATDDIINNDTVQDDVDNADSTEQEQNLSETKSQPEPSNIPTIDLESSDSDTSNIVIQDNQSFNITETSEKSAVDTSGNSIELVSSQPAALSQEAESKDSFSSKSNSEQKSACNVFEAEEESSQLEKNKKNQEDMETIDKDSEVNIAIKLFQDISADEWKKKDDEDDNGSVNSNHQSEAKQESDAECDLILVDKQAWLTAKDIKAQEEKESFEYDSDDTVLLKSQSDAARANDEAKTLDIVDEESVDIDSKKDEKVEEIKKRKSLTKKRSISKRNEDSSSECIDDEEISITVVKSKMSLNQSNNPSTSKLNNSGQAAKATKQTHENSDEEAEDDANKLNRSSQVNKNISLRKSTGGRKSLNKSLMNTSSNQDDDEENDVQMISINKSQMDISEEDNTDAHKEKSLKQTKRSLNKSRDNKTVADTECEKDLSNEDNKNASLNRSTNNKPKMIEISDDDESDNKCNNKMALSELKNYSIIAHAGTDTESSNDDDTDANSINSDVKKEYNLDGKKQKFSDDNVVGDDCRASESEYSDSNDNGSDLDGFIVSDDKVEDEEEEDEEEEDDQSIKKDDESEDVVTETIHEKNEEEDKDGEEDEEDENDEMDVKIISEIENKNDKDTCVHSEEEVDVEIVDKSIAKKNKKTFANNLKSRIESSTPKHSADKQAYWICEPPETPSVDLHPALFHKDTWYSDAKKTRKDTFEKLKTPVKGNTSLKEFNHTSYREEKLNRSLPSDLPNVKIKKAHTVKPDVKTNLARLHKTMNISDDDMSTIRHLRKEKLSESVPLRVDTKVTPLKKKLLLREETKKNTTQIEIKEKNNEEEVSDLVMPSTDDAIQKHSQRKKHKKQAGEALNENITNQDSRQKKRKKHAEEALNESITAQDSRQKKRKKHAEEALNESITDQDSRQKKRKKHAGEALNENITDQNQKVIESTTKIEVANHSPMLTAKDTTSKNLEQIKKKKKKKQIDVIEQNENVGEDNTTNSKLVAQKKKKSAQHSTVLITKDNNSKDSDQINEKKKKKKKKQIDIIEQEESMNEDKKNVRRNETELAQRNKKKADKIVSSLERDDYTVARKKRKEKEVLENKETLSEESTKNIVQIKTKKKINKKENACNQMMPISDDTVQKRSQKKRKRQTEEPLNENIDDEVVSQDPIETKKKIKRVKFSANEEEIKFAKQREPVTKDDVYENLNQINEKRKKKKKKQVAVTEQDNIINEDDINATKIGRRKEKEKKQVAVTEQDNIINEDDINAPKIGRKKRKRKEASSRN